MTVARLIGRERSRFVAVVVARGGALALAGGAVLLASATLALGDARWITRPFAPLGAWLAAAVLGIAIIWWTRRTAHRAATPASIARVIERERSLRAGSLRGALEVGESGALGRRAADALGARLTAASGALAPAMQRRALRVGAAAAAASIGALVMLGAARDRSPDGWRAVRHPLGALTGEILPPLEFVDPPRAVMRGEQLRVSVRAPERRAVTMRVRTTGAAWQTRTLPVHAGTATTMLGPLDADVSLVAEDGRVTTDTVVVRVTDRPFVGDVAIRAMYPAYLDRPAETVPVGEPVRVPRGTVLAIRGRASTVLADVGLVRERDTLRLVSDGHDFEGRLVAGVSGSWSWFAAAAQGPIADVPAPLELDVVPDSAPRIDILSPGRDTVVLAGATVPLHLEATDDHGLADIVLRSTRKMASGSVMPEVAQELAAPHAPQWSEDVPLDLAPRGLEPGDELHVVAVATDNSPWRQSASSRELVLRVPSLSELRQQARALADSTASEVAAAAKSERDLAQRTGEAARSRADRTSANRSPSSTPNDERDAERRTMSYQSAEEARALAREQQQLQEKIKQAQANAKSLEQQLRAAGVLDSSLTRQLRDAQQLLRDALTPQLQQQLQDVLKSTQQLSPDQVRRSLENLAQQQQQLKEQLERSAEMLKRAALEGSMQTLRDEAHDIARQERSLADSLSRGARAGDSAAAREAGPLAQRSKQLSKDVSDLQKRLSQEHAESGPRALQGASQRADSSAQAIQRAAPGSQSPGSPGEQRERQSGADRGQRTASAQDAARQMEQAAQQLGNARESQIGEWKKQLTSALDQSIQETMELSREQEGLADRARTGKTEGLRADQSAIQQGVQKVQQRLSQAARSSAHVSPQSQAALGEAARRVQDATRGAAEDSRGGQETASSMDEAAEALNRAAAQMVKDRARAAGAQSASGFEEMIEAMRDAAKQQGSVNAQSAGLLPVPGAQPSPQMLAQAQALAQQQRQIADKLEGAGAGDGGAERLAREMRAIASALERGQVDPTLLERQQQLFHRLLDAGLTLEKDEREDTGKREAEAPKHDSAVTTGTVSSGRSVERWREPTWSELRGLTADERRAVLEYFKRINAERP